MPTADIVILIVILVSALIGLVRGLLREVLSLASWFAAFILALYFCPTVARICWRRLRMKLSPGGGFIAVFVATLIAGGIVQWLLRKLVETSGLPVPIGFWDFCSAACAECWSASSL